MKIEVLGPGCPKCQQTEKNVRLAMERMGWEASVEHLTDIKQIAQRGVILTPALAVDGEVLISGHVPTVNEVMEALGAEPPKGD